MTSPKAKHNMEKLIENHPPKDYNDDFIVDYSKLMLDPMPYFDDEKKSIRFNMVQVTPMQRASNNFTDLKHLSAE